MQIGIDLGASKIESVLLDDNGNEHHNDTDLNGNDHYASRTAGICGGPVGVGLYAGHLGRCRSSN